METTATTNRNGADTMTTSTATIVANVYRVYFEGVDGKDVELIRAASRFEAAAIVARKYGLARNIDATLWFKP